MKKRINVLSLCDGISCARMALESLDIEIGSYFSAEIKPEAIRTTQKNFPLNIQIGDVTKIHYKNGELNCEKGKFKIKFDLVIFGSPCQSFSRAMKSERKIGLLDRTKSGLFLECNRILKEVNPKYFLMENTIMDKEDYNTISKLLNCKPIRINSKNYTGAYRDRYYWTNIKVGNLSTNKYITVNDIIDYGYCPYKTARCLRRNDSHGYYNGGNITPIKGFYRSHYKSFGTIIFPSEKYFNNCLSIATSILQGRKPQANLFDGYTGHDFDEIRYLSKYERARLQGIPEKYVDSITEKEAADLIGDAMTVPVIADLLKWARFE